MKKLLLLGAILLSANVCFAARWKGCEIYSADWCGPCQNLEADIAKSPGWKIGETGNVHFKVIKDFTGVDSIPLIIYYKDGKEVARINSYGGDIKNVLDTYREKVGN